MQHRVLAPITHESWFAEHNNRWTSIHPSLVNYICDAASLQFRRFIGIAHNSDFAVQGMLILEAMLPRELDSFRLWAPFYASLRFKQAPWWDPYTQELVYLCDLNTLTASTFTYYGTGGGNDAINVNTLGCGNVPPTPPPPTPGDGEHLYLTRDQIVAVLDETEPFPYLPLARGGQGQTYMSMAYRGWFRLP